MIVMNPTGQNQAPGNAPVTSLVSNWISYKRKRFWVLVVVLLYTLLGFFVAPVIIENRLLALAEQDLGRKARVENIAVNPYLLSLRIQGFEVDDEDLVPLVSFDEFFVNFQLSSLFHRAWTFAEIRLVEPFFLFERFNPGDSRLSRLLDDFSRLHPEDSPPVDTKDDGDTLPRLLVHDLNVRHGQIDVKDNVPETIVETVLMPINISIQTLNTLPDKTGKQSVTIQLADNSRVTLDGRISLTPLESSGEVVLDGLKLDPLIAYLRSSMPLDSLAAKLSTRFTYDVFMDSGGQPEINISDLSMNFEDIAVSGLEQMAEFINIPGIRFSGGRFQYPQQNLAFAKLTIEQPHLKLWLTEEGRLNLLDLVPASDSTSDDQRDQDTNSAWSVSIDDVQMTGALLELDDDSIEPAASLDIRDLNLSLTGVSNQSGSAMPLQLQGSPEQGGHIAMDGILQLLPEVSLEGRVKVTKLPLQIGQPYVQQFSRLQLDSGTIDSDIELKFSSIDQLEVAGSVSVPEFEISHQQNSSKLLSWHALEIDRFEYAQGNNKLNLSELAFDQLYGIFILDENNTSNISGLLIEQQGSNSESATSSPMQLVIGGVIVNDSSMDFSDLSLPLPFATYIANLDGNISTIDTSSDVPANINLEGQVDEFGLARINGSINVFDPLKHTDINLKFRNLLMSSLSPYTVDFAGREIDQGKLDVELGYAIDQGILKGTNDLVLSDLKLGRKVDHPGAASLPLSLAVSLLKDANGVIKVDLPVEGDINDPEFQIGGVIWSAVSGFIGKIVSAPFRFLGNLIGADSEELGQFEFLPGRSDLTPPEIEKVGKLELALQQRPELSIEIAGVVDRKLDSIALKKIKLVNAATEILGEEIDTRNDQSILLQERFRGLVISMFRERFPDVDTQTIKAGFTTLPESGSQKDAIVDELAYANALWKRLLDSEVIKDEDLLALAGARADSIREAFISNDDSMRDRVVIIGPREVESGDSTWIKLELSVASE